MCFICGKNGGVYGEELECKECKDRYHYDYKKMNQFLPKEFQIYRYDKLVKNRYR